ncbi:MAG: UDP-N-acetylmuramoyl-L-alanyl-D-glutamate--2,6-diaminopimelate ligase [Thermodesulfovibrionales bacterium]|nr:UDP-N-acetylmuramoyl-L-alanyl-D-glutamate--2,6-diaminopimelate ligase [Thermodesulfovibrionales bacterium]
MTLKGLIKDMEILQSSADTGMEIEGLSYDSRQVRPGYLFIAVSGLLHDGCDFIPDAIKRGATAVVSETHQEGLRTPREGGCGHIRVKDARDALALISNNFYGRPSLRLTVAGVTGTNGKTTTAFLIKSVLEHSGKKTGLIGTINYQIGDLSYPATHTTPEAVEFQGLLAGMLKAGCSHVVSEVSSHALSLKRADHTRFKVAVFTNLTRDHLDFHGTMENYFSAKKRLFAELLERGGTAVINTDDPYGRRLKDGLMNSGVRILTYGLEPGADLTASDIKNSFEGLTFTIRSGADAFSVESPMIGIPNVYNILSAAGASVAMGIGWEDIKRAVRQTGHAKGRFEKIDSGMGFICVVDYAHTEDALRRLITTARELTKGRVITVFGCGGDRDRGKRPAMGSVATELSDIAFITSDNPRGEDPMGIIREIEAGISEKNYKVVSDRREAIRLAVMEATPQDIVLIAGKGHEDYQETAGVRLPFSDREAAEKALRQRKN